MTSVSLFRSMSRRTLLLNAAAIGGGIAASRLGMPFISRGLAAEPIKIGVLAPNAGDRATTALAVAAGTQMVMALQGAKAMGQSVELVTLDENTVASTQINMKKLIEEHKVVAVLGGTDAASALAMNAIAGDAKIPLVVHSAMFDGLTGKNCTPWTFRVPIPFSIQFRALNPYLVGYGKKWFLLGVESVPGKAILELARHEMQGVGATEVGAETILPGDKADFTAAIQKIKDTKPNVVVGGLLGTNLTTFLKAWHAAGMTDKIPFTQIALTDYDAYAAGQDAITGVYAKTWHYSDPELSNEDKDFVINYTRQSGGVPPGTIAWQAYMGLRSLLSAIDTSGSMEPQKIRGGLLAFRYPSGTATLQYRESDHQMMHRVAVLETKTEISDKYSWWDVETHYPEKISDLDKLYGTAAQNGCTMTGG